MALTDIQWEDRHGRRAAVSVRITGLRVSTSGPRAHELELTDIDDLRDLRNALSDLLYARTGVR